MAFRTTQIKIRNQTGVRLQYIKAEVHGMWTPGLLPVPDFAPGQTRWFRSENNSPFAGTEGRVWYKVGDGPELFIHWNNPAVGLAFYEQSAPPGYGIYFTGGQGNDAEAEYTLIPSSRVEVRGFSPSRHGFAFENSWPEMHITTIDLPDPLPGLPVGNAAWGLCGGMSFASRDYFEANLWASEASTNPSGEGDPLFDYIVDRLLQSLNSGDVGDFVKFSDPAYPDTDDMFLGDGRNWTMAHRAWPGIRDVIDSGHPCPIGIVTGDWSDPTKIGHQVCAYAYQLSGNELTLWVYDPNSPSDDDITMVLDISRTDQKLIDVHTNIKTLGPITCFFTQAYEKRNPVQGRPPPPRVGCSSGPLSSPTREPQRLDVFWVGPDGGIGSHWWHGIPGENWGDHKPFAVALPGSVGGTRVTAVARDPNRLDVFWVAPDGAVWSHWWHGVPGENWGDHKPFAIAPPDSAYPDSQVAAVSRDR